MAQHFLLSAASRTTSLRAIYKAGEEAAYDTFCEMRWPETDGEAVCPCCGFDEAYKITTRRKFKCKACHHQFSVTSQYKTAFVLAHKLREAMALEVHTGEVLEGHVEIDGAFFGGHIRPENAKKDRVDRRLKENQTGKRRVVIAMREREGRTLPFVRKSEGEGVALANENVSRMATMSADEAGHWDAVPLPVCEPRRMAGRQPPHRQRHTSADCC